MARMRTQPLFFVLALAGCFRDTDRVLEDAGGDSSGESTADATTSNVGTSTSSAGGSEGSSESAGSEAPATSGEEGPPPDVPADPEVPVYGPCDRQLCTLEHDAGCVTCTGGACGGGADVCVSFCETDRDCPEADAATCIGGECLRLCDVEACDAGQICAQVMLSELVDVCLWPW